MSISTTVAIIKQSVIYFSFLIMLKIYTSKSGHFLCSHSLFDILPVLTMVKIRMQRFICSPCTPWQRIKGGKNEWVCCISTQTAVLWNYHFFNDLSKVATPREKSRVSKKQFSLCTSSWDSKREEPAWFRSAGSPLHLPNCREEQTKQQEFYFRIFFSTIRLCYLFQKQNV